MDLKYLKHALFYFFTAVLSLILIYYVTYHLFDGFAQTIVTQTAERVTQNQTLTVPAYLFRDETVIYSAKKGEVGHLVGDGDKVASGEGVAQVYAVVNPAVREKIMALDERIALYERSNAISGVTASDTSVIDRQIARLYLLLKDAQNKGDAEFLSHKQSELLVLLNRRAILTKTVLNYNDKIAALKAEKELLTASLSSVSATVSSPTSGFFYSRLDGYEELFTPAALDALTVERFLSLISREPGEEEAVGSAVGKLVRGYEWHLACPVDRALSERLSRDTAYQVLFPYNEDEQVEMTLSRILSSPSSDTAVLILHSTVMPDGFDYLRMQTINLVEQTHVGLRVSASAVRVVSGVQGVYVLEGSYVRFRAISPLYEDGGYLIVAEDGLQERSDGLSWLARYEEIIVEGKDLYDGKIIT